MKVESRLGNDNPEDYVGTLQKNERNISTIRQELFIQ